MICEKGKQGEGEGEVGNDAIVKREDKLGTGGMLSFLPSDPLPLALLAPPCHSLLLDCLLCSLLTASLGVQPDPPSSPLHQ